MVMYILYCSIHTRALHQWLVLMDTQIILILKFDTNLFKETVQELKAGLKFKIHFITRATGVHVLYVNPGHHSFVGRNMG